MSPLVIAVIFIWVGVGILFVMGSYAVGKKAGASKGGAC